MCIACQRQLTCYTVYSGWTMAKLWSTHTGARRCTLSPAGFVRLHTQGTLSTLLLVLSPLHFTLPSHGLLNCAAFESFRFLPGGWNLVWTTGGFRLMNSFYWTWINLRIEISQLLSLMISVRQRMCSAFQNCAEGNKLCVDCIGIKAVEACSVWCERRELYTPANENITS